MASKRLRQNREGKVAVSQKKSRRDDSIVQQEASAYSFGRKLGDETLVDILTFNERIDLDAAQLVYRRFKLVIESHSAQMCLRSIDLASLAWHEDTAHYNVLVHDATVPDFCIPSRATRSRRAVRDADLPHKSDVSVATQSVDEAMSLLMIACRDSVIAKFDLKQVKRVDVVMISSLVEAAPAFFVSELDLGVPTATNVPEGLLLDAVRAFRFCELNRIRLCPRADFPEENSAILMHCLHEGLVDVKFDWWKYDTAISEDDILKFGGGDAADRSGARWLSLRSSKISPTFFKSLVKAADEGRFAHDFRLKLTEPTVQQDVSGYEDFTRDGPIRRNGWNAQFGYYNDELHDFTYSS